jgi:hypothetical protein
MSQSPAPARIDCQLTADQNEIAVLRHLHHFGHLRVSDLARAVWPASPVKSALGMARRTLKRMEERLYVKARPNAIGSRSFILIERGCARLLAECGIEASPGYNFTPAGSRFMHHSIGARYLIERSIEGCAVWSESDVDQSRSPVDRQELSTRWKKVPDGFSSSSAHGAIRAVDWCEVEMASKVGSDVERILLMARHSGRWLDAARTVRLGRVLVIYDQRSSSGHETALVSALKRLLALPDQQLSADDKRCMIESLVFVRCSIDYPLVWQSHEEVAAHVALALAQSRRRHRATASPGASLKALFESRSSSTGEPIGPPAGATPAELEEWERWEREEYDEEQRLKAEQQALIAELERKRKAGQ